MQRRSNLLHYFNFLVILACLSMLASCREPFYPQIPDSNKNLLIIEGFINSGSGPTSIKLSRSANVYDHVNSKPESGARVWVEGEDNSMNTLTETAGSTKAAGTGIYAVAVLHLSPLVRYRLHIKCVSQEEYVSIYSQPLITPPVDSIEWTLNQAGAHFFVNTHDPANRTHYYRFITEGTWEINSAFFVYDQYIAPVVKYRAASEIPKLYYCWQYEYPSDLKLASSTDLKRDLISHFPLEDIPTGDIRLGVRYSMLVKEYAETAASYEFFQLLKKNSELTGSIFSSQPSQINGNFQTLTGGKAAIGYVNVGTETEKRIFISALQVPDWNYRVFCPIKSVPLDSLSFYFATYDPIMDITSPSGTLTGYQASYPDCTDCRFRGSPVKPFYW